MTATLNASPIPTPSAPAMRAAASSSPAGVRAILRLEGAAAFAAAVALYAHAGFSWPLFATPHSRAGSGDARPISSARGRARWPIISSTPTRSRCRWRSPAFGSPRRSPCGLGLIWIAHIGMDRMFGYGLKYAKRLRRHPSRPHRPEVIRIPDSGEPPCAFTPFRPAGCGSRRARSSGEAMGSSAASRR